MELTRRAYLTYEIRWPDRNSFVQNRDNYRQTRRVTFSLSPSLSLSLSLESRETNAFIPHRRQRERETTTKIFETRNSIR